MNYTTIKEVWKPIKGYENRYEVSDEGRVKSLKRKVLVNRKSGSYYNTVPGKLLEPTKVSGPNGGYLAVKLMRNNKGKTVKVHRLVADAFIDNPNDYPEVNHIDEDKTNNHVSNLEWCTRKTNVNHGTRKHRIYSHPNYKKRMKEMGETRRKKVKSINLKTGKTKVYESMLSAEKDGFANQCISKCCLGKRKTHKGHTWEFV
ncbi:NUMOD4 domain-containing protein [Gracilibacillus saliphilus]|uniref:NUMOD4 domain-containing protein n=1 Tax=Gracilibacillus saliphilus TaxID=543890 RepID=UPI0013CFF007|nr:NUMOD4 domain-containing protein [Gracilibacillus saliphilus]